MLPHAHIAFMYGVDVEACFGLVNSYALVNKHIHCQLHMQRGTVALHRSDFGLEDQQLILCQTASVNHWLACNKPL